MSILDQIMAYEDGEQTEEEYFAMFAELVKTGLAWQLQGVYGRTAARLIRDGYITEDGEVTL
jgi:hypothetical protein